jgi:hypothetical protein
MSGYGCLAMDINSSTRAASSVPSVNQMFSRVVGSYAHGHRMRQATVHHNKETSKYGVIGHSNRAAQILKSPLDTEGESAPYLVVSYWHADSKSATSDRLRSWLVPRARNLLDLLIAVEGVRLRTRVHHFSLSLIVQTPLHLFRILRLSIVPSLFDCTPDPVHFGF